MRTQFKMAEDPWDNYLVYDAKYFIPLLCHNTALPIEQQVLMVNFIKHSIKEETISQYKLQASSLIKELVQFANEFKDDDDEPSLIEKIKIASGDSKMRED